MQSRDDAIQVVRANAATWKLTKMVLKEGEFGYEKDTGRIKVGDGDTRWSLLPYYIPRPEIITLIRREIASNPAGELSLIPEVFNQETPQTTWTIIHDFGYDPISIQVFNEYGSRVADEYDVQFLEPGQVIRLGFDLAFAGHVRLR